MKKLLPLLFLPAGLCAQTPVANTAFNYSSFTPEKKVISAELQSLTDKHFYEHPEFGVLPFNAPCTDCAEILHKRDETHRYFVKNGTHGKEFYQQTAYSPLSYKENGVWHTIDSRLKPATQQGVYEAKRQPFHVTINVAEKLTSILNDGKELQVNRDLSIFIQHSDGSVTSLGEPDWSDYTAGDEGVMIHNFYAGIDLELRAGNGNMESFYRINKPLHLPDGWLVIRDNMKMPQGLALDYSHSQAEENNYFSGTLYINDAAGTNYFKIGSPAAYDENGAQDNTISLNYHVAGNDAYDLYVPIAWMNDAKRSYPLIIDPLVTATSVIPAASIYSGYDTVCFQNGCPNALNVAVPPACTITDIRTTFWFQAFNPCGISQGGWDITYNGCRWPDFVQWISCGLNIPGRCQLSDFSCFNVMQSCLPAPSCNPAPLLFTLNLYRCNQPGAACAPSCIGGDIITPMPWSVTVTGRTAEIDAASVTTSAPENSICRGGGTDLTAIASSGTPPYTYTWNPGAINGNQFAVSPSSTSTYTVSISDACGNTSSNTVTVIVDTVKPPAIIKNSADSICSGYTAFLSADSRPGLTYKWYLNGQEISGALDSIYEASSGGIYTCLVSDGCGDSLSNEVSITADTLINASFTLSADTNQLHHYLAVNYATGILPLSYDWSWGDGAHNYTAYPNHTYADSGFYDICLTITDSIGCSNTYCDSSFYIVRTTNTMIYVDVIPPVVTGINEQDLPGDAINIYPNPSKGSVTIQSGFIKSDNVRTEIYNMLGERVHSFMISAGELRRGYRIDLDAAGGLYLVVLRAGNAVMSKKLSLQK